MYIQLLLILLNHVGKRDRSEQILQIFSLIHYNSESKTFFLVLGSIHSSEVLIYNLEE